MSRVTEDLSGPDGAGRPAPPAPAGGWLSALRRSPLVRRVTGYSAGSIIAAFTSELAFAAAYGWAHSGTVWASLAGFVGGAVPNYVLNRRWAWNDRRGRTRRNEILLYAAVSLASFLVSVVVTDRVEQWARHLTSSRDARVVLVAVAYLAVSGVFFVAKFVAYELIVFTKGPAQRGAGAGAPRRPAPDGSARPSPAPAPAHRAGARRRPGPRR
jgi:putative flippase GtrA